MEVDLVVDARGLLCPLPVLRLRKRLIALQNGSIVKLLADDPAAFVDVPHFCAEAGHGFLGSEPEGDATAFLVERGGRAAQ